MEHPVIVTVRGGVVRIDLSIGTIGPNSRTVVAGKLNGTVVTPIPRRPLKGVSAIRPR